MLEELKIIDNSEKVKKEQIQEKISQEEAQKEVVKKDVEEKTGKSFEETRRLAIDIMETNEGFEHRNSSKVAQEMHDLDQNKVKDLYEKMQKSNLAQEIIYAGLGPRFLSTGVTTLKRNTQNISDKTQEFGDGNQMESTIWKVKIKYPQLKDEDIEHIDPEILKKLACESANENTSMEEKQLPEKEKSVLVKTKIFDSENKEIISEIGLNASESLDKILKEASQNGANSQISKNQKTEKKERFPLISKKIKESLIK